MNTLLAILVFEAVANELKRTRLISRLTERIIEDSLQESTKNSE